MTDEQIFDLLDDSRQRVEERFVASVEAVRVGTVIAHDRKAFNHWRNRRYRDAKQTRGMTGQALEGAVMNLAAMYPGNVTRGVMPPAAG